jgi:hypothetical protein
MLWSAEETVMFTKVTACALVLASAAGVATGDIVVKTFDSNGTLTDTDTYPNNQTINLTISNDDAILRIYAESPSTEDIPFIQLYDSSCCLDEDPTIIILSADLDAELGPDPVAIAGQDFGGIDTGFRGNVRFIGAIGGDLQGNIKFAGIWRFDAGGLIDGVLHSGFGPLDPPASPPFIITGNEFDGRIVANSGGVQSVEMSGNFDGDISVEDTEGGYIGEILIGGDLGTVSHRADITVGDVSPSGFHIAVLDVGGDVFAKVGGGGAPNSGDDYLEIDEIVIGNDLASSSTLYFEGVNTFLVGRDMLGGAIFDGELDTNSVIIIEREYDGVISLPAAGLQGQIVVNNSDDNTNGLWTSDIDVGSDPLLEGYTETASYVGGGAAGRVPFMLHDESCDPATGSSVTIYGMFPNQLGLDCESRPFTKATLRMYGPVALDGSGPYFDVLKDGPLGFVPVSFTYSATIKSGTGEREVEITKTSGGSAWPLGDYRIVPKAGEVTCLGAANNPDVDAFIYEFSLVDTCELGLLMMYDLNQDDTVCMQDVAAWTSRPCDFNGDSAADAVDLDALMNVATNWAY